MGCCHARDEKAKDALGLNGAGADKSDNKKKLDESAGLEFYLNTSGAYEEDDAFGKRRSLE